MAKEEKLRVFMRRKQLVRFAKSFDSGRTQGYIVGVSADLVLVLRVGDGIRFDGFEVHRIRDVRRMQEDYRADFVEVVIKRRRERRPVKPRIQLGRFAEVLRSAGRHYKLITIHRQRIDPEICQIGSVVDVGAHRVTLHEIRPDATWRDDLDDYALREITRIDFGGDYEDALGLVCGVPAQPNHRLQLTGNVRE